MHNRNTLEPCKTVRRSGSSPRARARVTAPAAATFAASLSVGAFAGPTGGVVVEGTGSISTPNAGSTVIDQASQNLQLNWNSFNIGANESVQFNQPSSSAVALNRILDQNPSQIFGRLQANGQVVLVNPNGLLIGRTAQLNVNSLVVSSLDAIDFDSASGRYRFSASRNDIGAILNEGTITAGRGGSVTLLGGQVSNTGTIVADLGSVNLAAGRAATIDLAGDGLLRLEVSPDLLANASGSASAVENSGTIQANGGQVLLTASAVKDVFANLINNTGVVRANRIDNVGGTIRLTGPEGTVRSSGTLDASAGDAASSGGRVEVLGERVGLFDHAVVDVSGASDGGTALIGGDYQGKNPGVLNADRTYVGANATINADAGEHGDGGKVIVWADEYTRFDGQITARSGSQSGDGGFAEVSGKQTLAFNGRSDLRAAYGTTGTLLLDPDDITIVDDPDTTAPGDGDELYEFTEDPGQSVDVTNSAIETLLASNNVTLQAENSILQQSGADIDVATNRTLKLESHGTIDLQGDINLHSGGVTLEATNNIFLRGNITGGDVSITSNNGNLVDDAFTGTKITADTLSLAGNQIGTAGGYIDTNNVGSLTAIADVASLYVRNQGTNELTLQSVAANGPGNNNLIIRSPNSDVRVVSVVSSGLAQIEAGGAILDDGNDTPVSAIRADTLNLSGTAIGTVSAQGSIDTDVDTITATASSGGVYIREASDITIDDIHATNVGANMVLAAGGNITVGTIQVENQVTLQQPDSVSTAILDDGDDSTRITTKVLNLTGNRIGGTGLHQDIDTSVDTLTGLSRRNGMVIREQNGILLNNLNASNGGDVAVTSDAGNIRIGNVVGSGDVTLTASNGNLVDDGNPGTWLQAAGHMNLTGLGIGGNIPPDKPLDTMANTLEAHATGAGGIFIRESDGATLTNLTTTGQMIEVQSLNGNLTVGSMSVPGAGLVRMVTQNGSILDDRNNATRISSFELQLNSTGAIGGSDLNDHQELDIDAVVVSAQALGGGIYLGELNNVTLAGLNASPGATSDIVVNAGGDIAMNSISAEDSVSLTAGGSITDSGPGTGISTGALHLQAGAIGIDPNNRLGIAVSSLTAATTNGSIYIEEANGLDLQQVTALGTGRNIDILSTTGNITAGDIEALGDTVILRALGTGASILGTAGQRITANTVELRADVGIGSATTAVGTDTTFLKASSTGGGIYVDELNNLTLQGVNTTGNATIAAGGAINDDVGSILEAIDLTLTAGTSIGSTGSPLKTDVDNLTASAAAGGIFIHEADGIQLTSVVANGTSNDVSVTADNGSITVQTVTAPDDVTLTATNGSILDIPLVNTRIQATDLTLTALGSIGAAGAGDEIDTAVTTLNASSSNGGIYIGELDSVQVGAVTAANGEVVLRAGNTLTDDGDDSTFVEGTTGVTLAAGSAIGTVTDFVNVLGSSIDVRTLGVLKAEVTSNSGGQINLNIDGAPVLTGGAIKLGDGVATGRSGTVILQSANNLDVGGLAAGAISIGAGNHASVGLSSGGVLTLPTAGGFTDAPAENLLVRGLTDVVDDDHNFFVDGVGLTFHSGGAGGPAVLNTTVDHLNATLGNGQSLTINETDSVELGTISATTVSIAAGGAVTDDDDNATLISGTTVALSGTALGAAGHELDTDAGTLNATASAGGIYVHEANAVTLGTVNANGDVVLAAGGAITSSGSPLTATGAATLTGTSIGTSGARLNTAVASLNATATTGDIYVQEADGVDLSATAAGAVDVATTDGTLTVASASGNGVTLAIGGDGRALALNGAVNGGTGNVTLTSAGNSSTISVNSTLTAAGLTATANGTAGVININGVVTAGAGGVVMSAAGSGGQIALNNTVNAGAGGVSATAAGDIGVSSTVTTAGNATLTAGGAITSNNGRISAAALTASGASIGAAGSASAKLGTTVASLNATTTNGDIHIEETDSLTLSATATGGAVDVSTLNGALTVSAATGTGVTLAAGGVGNDLILNSAVSGGSGDVSLVAGGAITSNGGLISGAALGASGTRIGTDAAALNTNVTALDAQASNGGIYINEANDLVVNRAAATGEVRLAANGALTGGSGNVSGNGVTLTGTSIGSSAARLNTAATSLNATSTNGGIYINEADALDLTASATAGALDVQAHGALTVSTATGEGVSLMTTHGGADILLNTIVNGGSNAVTLTAGGAVVAAAGSHINGASLTATGATIGDTINRLNTTVGSLNATSTGGGIFVTESDALTLNANATGGAVDVRTGSGSLTVNSATGSGVTLIAGGAGSGITLNGAVDAGATGDVVLTAGPSTSRGAITAGAGNRVTGRTLTALGNSIGSSASALNTTLENLNADASTGGVYVSEQNGLRLADVRAASDVQVASGTGNITVNAVSAGQNASLTANGGAINDDGDNTTRLAAPNVTLRARSIGAPSTMTGVTLDSTQRLDITATTLDAASTDGGIFIDEANGLDSVSVQAGGGGSGDIELLSATGNLNLLNVSASDTLLLSAGGDILALPGLSNISARAAELRAGGADPTAGHIGLLSSPFTLRLSAGNTLRMFVPSTIDPNDPARAPATLPSAGVTSILSLFGAPSALSVQAGFGQFTGLSDTQFTSAAEALVRSIQNQTTNVQTVLGLDWASFDPNVSLFGTIDPSVCMPADQRDEEDGASGC